MLRIESNNDLLMKFKEILFHILYILKTIYGVLKVQRMQNNPYYIFTIMWKYIYFSSK